MRSRRSLSAAVLLLLSLLGVAQAAHAQAISRAAIASAVTRGEALGPVSSSESVETTDSAAEAALDPGYISGGDAGKAVNLVVLRGSFVDLNAKVPAGEAPPSGTVLAYLLDDSGKLAGTYIGNRTPKLSTLGPVQRAHVATARAAAFRRRVARRRAPKARAATWGTSCKLAEEHHCYAQAQWNMSGSEEVLGATEEVETTLMEVPEFESGAFVDDEMWVSLGSGTNGNHWMEVGQENGSPSCCHLWWFRAYKNNLGYYQLSPSEEWEIALNTWAKYRIETIGSGGWCWYIGPNYETQDGCRANFPDSSKRLTDGMEVDSETEPSNAAKFVVTAQHLNEKWFTWNKATNETINGEGLSTTHTCISEYLAHPGDVNVSTC